MKGFARGTARFDGLGDYAGRKLAIDFQNENLVARSNGHVVASVPDLITVLDSEMGHPVTTEGLRYGFRCVVISIPCDPQWRTSEGLKLVGPRYFGYDVDYEPIEVRLGGRPA